MMGWHLMHPLSNEERAEAAPVPDEDGAIWKMRIEPSLRKGRAVGRTLNLPEWSGLFPFRDSLVDRSELAHGLRLENVAIRLPGKLGTFADNSAREIACALTADGSSPDVLYFRGCKTGQNDF
jgi:hypothetical protein